MENSILVEKRNEYMDYIKEHLQLVQESFLELKNMNNSEINKLFSNNIDLINELRERIINHDLSKYSDEEFEGYRKYYYPVNEEEKESSKAEFDKAWEHHWKNNDHHWQNRQTSDILNRGACLEMICDWMAMSKKFNNNIWDWYEDNKSEIILNESEREYTERLINAIKEVKSNENN